MRPTSLLLRKQPHSKWSELDFVLFDAYESMKSETSTSTGLPVWLTRSGDPGFAFRIDTLTDHADEALSRYDEDQQGKKNKAHGVVRYLVPVAHGDAPVPEGGLERARLLTAMQQASIEGVAGLPGSTLDDDLIERKKPAGGYDLSEYG